MSRSNRHPILHDTTTIVCSPARFWQKIVRSLSLTMRNFLDAWQRLALGLR